MPINLDSEEIQSLIEAFLSLRNKRECKEFLRDLLTEAELQEFGLRWKAARMLDAQIPYTEIVKETGLSSTTVARISKWLKNGTGGYKRVMQRTKTLPSRRP